MIQVLFHHGQPVAAYESTADAMRSILDLPGWADPDLLLIGVPVGAALVANEGQITAAPERGGCGVSRTPAPGPVTLSPNGNKKE